MDRLRRHSRERLRCSGFTLWEALCCAALAAAVVGLAAPSFEAFLLDMRRSAAMNAFVSAIQLARSEAAKRRRPVVLCKTRDGLACGTSGLRYDAGWMVFVNTDDVRPPHRSAAEPLLHRYAPLGGARITSNRHRFEFRPFRRRSTNGTVTFCDRRGDPAARAVIVSYTGRPRVDATGPGNRALICAPLP